MRLYIRKGKENLGYSFLLAALQALSNRLDGQEDISAMGEWSGFLRHTRAAISYGAECYCAVTEHDYELRLWARNGEGKWILYLRLDTYAVE